MLAVQPAAESPEWDDFAKLSEAGVSIRGFEADIRIREYGNNKWSWTIEAWISGNDGYPTREQAKAGVIGALTRMGFSDAVRGLQ